MNISSSFMFFAVQVSFRSHLEKESYGFWNVVYRKYIFELLRERKAKILFYWTIKPVNYFYV